MSVVPLGGVVGAALFAVVVALVGVWLFRFGPYGDLWEWAREAGVQPWLAVAAVLVVAGALMVWRLGGN